MSKDDVRIEIAAPIHREGILDLAEIYVRNEPVRAAMKVTWESSKDGWAKMIDDCLMVPHSHVAVNGAGKVVGFRLSRILDLEKYKPEDSLNEFISFAFTRNLEDNLTKDWATVYVDENGQRCKKILQFLGVGVHPEYGGRGLAVEMSRENMKLAKELGCELCTVVASNWMSQRVFEKLGFTTVAMTKFEDLKGPDGRPQIEMADPKQAGTKWQIIRL